MKDLNIKNAETFVKILVNSGLFGVDGRGPQLSTNMLIFILLGSGPI